MISPKIDASAVLLLVEILDAGSISQAARKLNVTRSNISLRLKQIEQAAGTQLIRRNTRNIEPTEVGLRLYAHGSNIRDELTAAQEAIGHLGDTLNGEVRLCVPTGFGNMVMKDWLLDFKRMYPEIVLAVTFENGVDDFLLKGIDVSIRIVSEPSPALIARELMKMKYLVCVSSDYGSSNVLPERLSDLEQAPLLTSEFVGNNLRVRARRGNEEQEVTVKPKIISANFMFIREAILAGLGVGFLPDYMVERDICEGRMATVLDDWHFNGAYGNSIFLLRMAQRYQTVAMRTLIDFITAKVESYKEKRGLGIF
ncbi:HTH-type transcriptional regulator DmlR [Burkholderia sp. AD24]|nr:HTH-type transcriptional regulator DmlR [Burkholderia sp. AD24]